MDPRIVKISHLLGLPTDSLRWKEGDAWFENPIFLRMCTRLAAVMEYVEAEYGIRDDEDRQQLVLFLRDLHSAFCNRLENGEKLEAITFPPEILEDYETDFEGRYPSRLVIEKLRSQFDNSAGH